MDKEYYVVLDMAWEEPYATSGELSKSIKDSRYYPPNLEFDVLQLHGPAGGNPEIRVLGSKADLEKFMETYCGMEDWQHHYPNRILPI